MRGESTLTPVPLRVVVVDDDFLVAKLHGKFVESLPGYQLIGTANQYEQALALVTELRPDVLLLDVYMPDNSGIELLRTIRTQNLPCDVILITAAKELEMVEEGFRLGIFDYLIKPFDLERLKKSLEEYVQFRKQLSTSKADSMDQTIVDDLKRLRSMAPTPTNSQRQKGIDMRTLELIKQALPHAPELISIEEVADKVGVSRSTARVYLVHLIEEKFAEEQLLYGTVGRPQRLFRVKN